MAFPTVRDRTTGTNPSGTSHSITLPTDIAAGDRLLVFLRTTSGSVTWSPSAGWTELAEVANATPVVKGVIYWRIATDDANDALTVTSSGNAADSHISLSIAGAGTPTVSSATSSGATANGNPPSLTPPGGADDYLWIAALCSQTSAPSAAPASYGNLRTSTGVGTAERSVNAASEDPGTFTSTSAVWVSFTVAVPPGAAPPDTSKFMPFFL